MILTIYMIAILLAGLVVSWRIPFMVSHSIHSEKEYSIFAGTLILFGGIGCFLSFIQYLLGVFL